jgi:hypothetical protein
VQFVDNRHGNTVAAALCAYAAYQQAKYGRVEPLAIASGYFDLGGFAAIEEVLAAAPSVRILLGAEPRVPTPERLRLPGEPMPQPAEVLAEGEEGMRADRDLLAFSAETDRLLRRLLAFLARPEVEVRRYTRQFLHGKAFIYGDEAGVRAGSANFTRKGLTENLELDLGRYEPSAVKPVRRWFDELWDEAEPFDLAAAYSGREQPYDPHTIYLRLLLELYEDELLGDDRPGLPGSAHLSLAEFQREGTERALRILERWHGAVLADGVGRGKTYMAGNIISTFHARGQRVLVLTPARLRENWESFFVREKLPSTEVRSYQELARDIRVAPPPSPGDPGPRRPVLDFEPAAYGLVVVDEAHAFRNAGTQYYRALRRLMAAPGPARKLLLLTATPVNNSLWDLYHQVMLFCRHDAAFTPLGIPQLREFFKQAMGMDLSAAAPQHLFPLLNAVSVRRTRQHVQRYYPGETVQTVDGPLEIRFPEAHLLPVAYSCEALMPGFFAAVAAAVDHDLTLARYRPDAYRSAGGADAASQEALAGLLRSQLLKRFESSVFAFRRTLEKLISGHDAFLRLLASGRVARPGLDVEAVGDDLDDGFLQQLEEGEALVSAEAFDVPRLQADVQADRERLRQLLSRANGVDSRSDPKLLALWRVLEDCAGQPAGNGRKVVVFSYFADTVEYVARSLAEAPEAVRAAYGERCAVAAGSGLPKDTPHLADPDAAVAGFAPASYGKAPGPGRYDLLLTTDVLAEGQNLQQACRVVNLDLPWNPMRLAQRNGRVDRIGSPHAAVYLYCFLPTAELDAILDLEARLRGKIAQANAAVGTESPVLPGMEALPRDFTDLKREIARVAAGDATLLDDQNDAEEAASGEVFRNELRAALMSARLEELRGLPWGAGSGRWEARGGPGVVFAARVGKLRYWRFAPLDPREATDPSFLNALQLARCPENEPRWLPEEVRVRLYQLWERARQDIFTEHQRLCDPAESAGAVPPAQREAVALLFRQPVEGAEAAQAALQVPWPRSVSSGLRSLLAQLQEGASEPYVTRRIVEFVQAEGLRGPDPGDLPQAVEIKDIHLICYQYVGADRQKPSDKRDAGAGLHGPPTEVALDPSLDRARPRRLL